MQLYDRSAVFFSSQTAFYNCLTGLVCVYMCVHVCMYVYVCMCATSVLGVLLIDVILYNALTLNLAKNSKCSTIRFNNELLLSFLGTLPANCLGVLGGINCNADGSCTYTASYAVQQDDSVTFIVSAWTPANTWVGLAVSDDQFMVSAAV